MKIARSNSGNWWVTYQDGRLAHPRPLDTREQARAVLRTLQGKALQA